MHQCARVLNNKNAKVTRVAKQLLERLKSNSKMSNSEIVNDIRTRFSVGITSSTAYKAKKLALEIIEGDANRQYSLCYGRIVQSWKKSVKAIHAK